MRLQSSSEDNTFYASHSKPTEEYTCLSVHSFNLRLKTIFTVVYVKIKNFICQVRDSAKILLKIGDVMVIRKVWLYF